MQRTYARVNRRNCSLGHQPIYAVLPYRWDGIWPNGDPDPWNLVEKLSYHDDLRNALQCDYRWRVDPDESFGPALDPTGALQRIKLIESSLFDLQADAIVHSANVEMIFDGTIGRQILSRAGRIIQVEAQSMTPVPLGQAIATSAYGLATRHIIHTPIRESGKSATYESVAQAVKAALTLADRLGDVQHIALPSIGTLTAGLDPDKAAASILPGVVEYLQRGSRLRQVTFALLDDENYRAYLEVYQSRGGVLTTDVRQPEIHTRGESPEPTEESPESPELPEPAVEAPTLPEHLQVRVRSEEGLIVRATPNTDAQQAARVADGTILDVLEDPDRAEAKIGVQGQWLQVRTPDGVEGYVAAWYVGTDVQRDGSPHVHEPEVLEELPDWPRELGTPEEVPVAKPPSVGPTADLGTETSTELQTGASTAGPPSLEPPPETAAQVPTLIEGELEDRAKVSFVDSPPDHAWPGDKLAVSVELYNPASRPKLFYTTSALVDAGYRAVPDDPSLGPPHEQRQSLEVTLPPGSAKVVNFSFTAPTIAGTYQTRWDLVAEEESYLLLDHRLEVLRPVLRP
jgi:O-acetyl-ADP-ribose deacetylase (regulator of RNase III)